MGNESEKKKPGERVAEFLRGLELTACASARHSGRHATAEQPSPAAIEALVWAEATGALAELAAVAVRVLRDCGGEEFYAAVELADGWKRSDTLQTLADGEASREPDAPAAAPAAPERARVVSDEGPGRGVVARMQIGEGVLEGAGRAADSAERPEFSPRGVRSGFRFSEVRELATPIGVEVHRASDGFLHPLPLPPAAEGRPFTLEEPEQVGDLHEQLARVHGPGLFAITLSDAEGRTYRYMVFESGGIGAPVAGGAVAPAAPPPMPTLPMVLHCPVCGLQHVDKPDPESGWTNPPHRTHLCGGCGVLWRPANVPTEGVESLDGNGPPIDDEDRDRGNLLVALATLARASYGDDVTDREADRWRELAHEGRISWDRVRGTAERRLQVIREAHRLLEQVVTLPEMPAGAARELLATELRPKGR